jgi:ribosomal protein L16 Arg81 hydroxylase
MPPSSTDLEFLLAPTSADEFFSRHWETTPLVVARREPERFASLLDVQDLDYVVSAACALPNASAESSPVELLGDSTLIREIESRHTHRVAAVYDAYRRGATIRVNGAQQFWKPLRLLCRALEQVFSFPVKANLYATPAGARTSPRHYDKHDVLVLQLAGRKHWRIYHPVAPLPLAHTPSLPFEERGHELKHHRGGPKKGRANINDEESGPPLLEHLAQAGDTLYLPRGFVHEASATADDSSLHVTLGIHVLTWMHLFSVALGQTSNRDERFRRALPVGFANETATDARALKATFDELLQALAQNADAQRAIEETAWSFLVSTQAVGEGSLAGAQDATGIDAQTLLRRRPGLICRLVFDGDNAGLATPHNTLWMPKTFAHALRFIAQTSELRPAQIPGSMSDKSKLVLARRLVEDGFLMTHSES